MFLSLGFASSLFVQAKSPNQYFAFPQEKLISKRAQRKTQIYLRFWIYT
jgi:hypothetical protein